ncbi:MAG: hypothetical protein ACKOZL_03210 [Actinomycetes bacterium]
MVGVPWCDQCDEYVGAGSVTPEGRCPTCGGRVDRGDVAARVSARAGEEPMPVPWHLKLLALGVVVYLGFRLWQGIGWLLR